MKTIRPRSGLPEGGNRGAGFTLTELVVVLATVALLIVVCLPVLAGTKDQSRVAQCAGNLRQFTLAMHIYGGEYNDKLPSSSSGNWPWDLTWNAGNVITQWVSWRQLYCPGTSVRFTDQDNFYLWNYYPGSSGSFHVINYAMTFPGTVVSSTNQNPTLTPQRILFNGTYLSAPPPAQRVLLADATISAAGQYNYALRNSYNYTDIAGGYSVHHLSPHLNGLIPAGGNLGMLDGHVEWRKFDNMQCRVINSSPGFWW